MPGVVRPASSALPGGLCWALLAALPGCGGGPTAAPPSLTPPQAVATTVSFAGSPLSGPTAPPSWLTTGACDAGAAWRVQVEWYVVRSAPGLGLDPLEPWTRLVVIAPDTAPSFGPTALGAGAVLGRVPDADDLSRSLRAREGALRVAVQQGALPAGVTTAFTLTEADLLRGDLAAPEDLDAVTPLARVALHLHRPAGRAVARRARRRASTTVQAAAPRAAPPAGGASAAANGALGGLAGLASSSRARPGGPGKPPDLPVEVSLELVGHAPGDDPCRPGPVRHELLVLSEVLEPVGEGLVLVLPSPLPPPAGGERGARSLLALARLRPAPAAGAPGHADHRDALARTLAGVQRSCPPEGADPPPTVGLATPSLEAARAGLRDPREQRHVLLALADAGESRFMSAVALSGERADIDGIARAVADQLTLPVAPTRGPALGWLLDRAAIEHYAATIATREASPAGQAILGRFAGAVAERAAFLQLFQAARDGRELQTLLARENAALLDDPSAGIRARAAEWLAREHPDLLPPGFDPLAPARERRAALARLRRRSGVGPEEGSKTLEAGHGAPAPEADDRRSGPGQEQEQEQER